MNHIKQNVIYLLEEFPFTRNFPNMEFCKYYWIIIDRVKSIEDIGTDSETIRRIKQKLVEEDFGKYGPTDEKLIEGKHHKKMEVESFVNL